MSHADELAKLASLHAAGALSDAEFAAAKAAVLGSVSPPRPEPPPPAAAQWRQGGGPPDTPNRLNESRRFVLPLLIVGGLLLAGTAILVLQNNKSRSSRPATSIAATTRPKPPSSSDFKVTCAFDEETVVTGYASGTVRSSNPEAADVIVKVTIRAFNGKLVDTRRISMSGVSSSDGILSWEIPDLFVGIECDAKVELVTPS